MAADADANAFSPRALPTPADLAAAAALPVFTSSGSQLPFSALLSSTGKTLVIFIRHFHCCVCQDYITLLAGVREEALTAAGLELVVIGCGDHTVIQEYRETTGYKGPVYADPSKSLYLCLGMTKRTLAATPKGEERKDYVRAGYLQYAIRGALVRPLSHPLSFIKAGDIQQLGGEFLFQPGGECTWVSRMTHTADHTDVKDLMALAGVEYP
ncbi:hypothetical protein CALCODRAFT_425929 [Calocera cornea HHB12733]|uniref:AhpC-TSA-domain-containing protein n=1 Tax=Calocera cornea HHB12733 TaxID=1353952 RepID=A0A165K5X2_9BASI|nr:hypothetical protein CALCODRAFT_425929 [Calocera cornea HHB12733]